MLNSLRGLLPQNGTFRKLVISFLIGTLLTISLVGLACIPRLELFAFLLLPGAFGAALVFRQGIHSDWALTYMALAGLLDIAMFSALILLLSGRTKKR